MTKNLTFQVENFKGVENVEIRASSGDLVVIAGKNGAGKSSFIDAITELFDARGARLTPKPIRDGEKKAVAEFVDNDIGIRVKRTWTKDDAGKLEVYATDGAKYSKPKDVLAKLTGGLIFDPGRFLGLDARQQRDELLAKVALPFDLEKLEREKAGAQERRLEAGREVKRLSGALSLLREPAADTPVEEVSVAALMHEAQEARKVRDAAAQEDEALARIVKRGTQIEEQIATLRDELKALEDQATDMKFKKSTRAPLPDEDAILARLDAAEGVNEAIREAARWRETKRDLDAAESAHRAAEGAIAAVEDKKVSGLSGVDWPDAGLGLTEDGVTLDGIPFKQVNTARKILAAARIATSGEPELRLVIVSDGDLLDADSLASVRELAAERSFTVLMERDRDESREVGFEIIEGNLVA